MSVRRETRTMAEARTVMGKALFTQ
jgi:hypothetical protein